MELINDPIKEKGPNVLSFEIYQEGESFLIWANEDVAESMSYTVWQITRIKTGNNIRGKVKITLDQRRQALFLESWKDLMEQARTKIKNHFKTMAKRSKGKK